MEYALYMWTELQGLVYDMILGRPSECIAIWGLLVMVVTLAIIARLEDIL